MRVVIFGAAGPTGRLLVKQALERGHHVTAVTRRAGEFPIREEGLRVVRADATDADQVAEAIEGAQAVVSVLGAPYGRAPISIYSAGARMIVDAMEAQGVRRLVVTSSSAAKPWPDPSWSWLERSVVHRILNSLGATLYADMRRMEAIVESSGLEWTIMRPLGLANMEPPTEYSVAVDHISGRQTARRDLASAILDELGTPQVDGPVRLVHPRQRVAVATTNKTVGLPVTIWREGIRPQLTATRTSGRRADIQRTGIEYSDHRRTP